MDLSEPFRLPKGYDRESIGLCFSVVEAGTYVSRAGDELRPVTCSAAVAAAAAAEYVAAEILELSGNAARDNRHNFITPRHVGLCISNDEAPSPEPFHLESHPDNNPHLQELCTLWNRGRSTTVGCATNLVLPHISAQFLPPRTWDLPPVGYRQSRKEKKPAGGVGIKKVVAPVGLSAKSRWIDGVLSNAKASLERTLVSLNRLHDTLPEGQTASFGVLPEALACVTAAANRASCGRTVCVCESTLLESSENFIEVPETLNYDPADDSDPDETYNYVDIGVEKADWTEAKPRTCQSPDSQPHNLTTSQPRNLATS